MRTAKSLWLIVTVSFICDDGLKAADICDHGVSGKRARQK